MHVNMEVFAETVTFVTRLEYQYVQVIVDLLCENATLVHYFVVVCNHVSPLFLCLEQCVIISKF